MLNNKKIKQINIDCVQSFVVVSSCWFHNGIDKHPVKCMLGYIGAKFRMVGEPRMALGEPILIRSSQE